MKMGGFDLNGCDCRVRPRHSGSTRGYPLKAPDGTRPSSNHRKFTVNPHAHRGYQADTKLGTKGRGSWDPVANEIAEQKGSPNHAGHWPSLAHHNSSSRSVPPTCLEAHALPKPACAGLSPQLRDGIDITAGARVTRVFPPVVTRMTGSPAARVSLPLACTMARRSPLRS